ncbi:DUF2612 domain-containing protein [Clostridium rectalis]|uniref:DUF2612 domain-containing protein n=1 Tax=Clostridium rectalis TaxID=2040295 RepID=UPI000F63F1C2|nr:DUF2612 domain-containing protein [Clostridium rectalis]
METKDRMINLLPYYIQNGKNINKYFGVLAKMYNELIDIFTNILNSRNLDSSTLYGLDIIGDIIGEKRLGRNDKDYRSALKTKIIANRSTGDIETINNYMKSLMGSFYIGIIEGNNTNITLRYSYPSIDNPVAYLKKATAAGVSIDTQIQTYVPVVGQMLGTLQLNKRPTII